MRRVLRLACLGVLAIGAAAAAACSTDTEGDGVAQPGVDDAGDGGGDATTTPDVVTGDGPTVDQDVPDGDLDAGPKCKTASCATAIGAGPYHTCAVLGDRTVKCWGDNTHGALGTGTVSAGVVSPAVSVALVGAAGVTDAVAVAGGGEPGASSFSCALLSTGAVQCWGSNSYGQLGGGVDASVSPSGGIVPSPAPAAAIGVGVRHGCMLDNAGALRCWGSNSYNERGDAGVLQPVGVPTDAGLTGLAAGFYETCVVTSAGGLICMGYNTNGQADPTSAATKVAPTFVDAGGSVQAVSTRASFVCATLAGSKVSCWGINNAAQLGRPVSTSLPPGSPDFSPGIAPASVTAGGAHACVVMEDRGVSCWGANAKGQVADFTLKSVVPSPYGVGGVSKVVQLALGYEHSCALTDDGDIYCWGSHAKGQLGPNGNPGAPPADAGDGGTIPGKDAGPDNLPHPDAVKVPL